MSVTGRSVAWNPHGKEDTQKLTQTDPLLSQLLSYVTSTHKEIDQSVYFSGMMSVVKFCNFFSGWNCCPYDTLQSELKMGRKQHPLNPTSALLWAPLRAEKHLKNGEFQSISKRTIIKVTDSYTTGIASARTSIIQHQLAKIYDRTIRKPARFNCILLLPDECFGVTRPFQDERLGKGSGPQD